VLLFSLLIIDVANTERITIIRVTVMNPNTENISVIIEPYGVRKITLNTIM
jgi:hypothetical protein